MNQEYFGDQVKDDFEAYYGEQYRQAKNDDERYELVQQALDSDEVTGNDIGSYYLNRQEAKEMVLANIEYIAKGFSNEGWIATPLEDFIACDDWEILDTIARYHTLDDLWERDEL